MRLLARASLCSLLTLPIPLAAQGWIVPRPCTIRILPAVDVPRFDCRPNISRTRSDVHVELINHVLHYQVEERFVNRGATVGEADYLFPLPNDAAFQDLQLSINGELVSGETMNAGDARRIYEQIVRSQRDPALVEWMGHGLLRARVFPLNPGEEKRIVVRFQSVAPREGDALRIDYFRGNSSAARNASSVRDDGASSFTLQYTPASDLGTPYSPTHSLDFSEHDGKRVATVRGDAHDVTLLVPVRRNTAAAITMLAYAPGNENGFALVNVTPPSAAAVQSTPRDITLVLDVSGSMQGRKIEQARAAGRQLLGTLRPVDRFKLIDFSSDVRTFKDDFVPATPDNLRDATRYLDALEAQGGTNIEAALREATRAPVSAGRLPLVLFVTDGEPTIGEQRPDRLVSLAADARVSARAATGERRRIFTFGLGSDVNVSLLEQLALEGRGTSQFVRPEESVERMVGIVANSLVDPVLTDVRVHVEGDVKLSQMLPTQSADIFADRELVLLARYSGHGSARVVVDGLRRGTPVQWTSTVSFPDRQRENPFVARLWATQRVGFLSAERRKNGSSTELDDEIRALGERYGIPTELTSYLVTEPRFAVNRIGAAAPPRLAAAFEQAKTASAQRAASSVAVLDSLSVAADAAGAGSAAGSSTQRIAGRTFVLRDGMWTDARYQAGMPTTTIAPYSKAYFDVMDQLPELRAVFALGGKVAVVGHDHAIVVADGGVEALAATALTALVRAW
jgi:Ca-activated chloride channel family protein